MTKKLFRIKEGKMLAGVCTGIGEYFEVDVTIIRLAWILFGLFAGAGLLAYIIAAIIIPARPDIYIER